MQDISKLVVELVNGNRRALSNAITLVESSRADHRAASEILFDGLLNAGRREAVRIAVSGPPGVGKSTLIDALGCMLADQGKSIAVLAIDPSSVRTGGSILGDKTRMGQLASHPGSYIRPSPTNLALGGATLKSREVVFLLEQAGFDYVLIETTGVGQSETDAAEFSDVFALLLAPAGGDELQGVKRGIVEFADLIVVNKADGNLSDAAIATAAEYLGALRVTAARDRRPPGSPKVLTCSAVEQSRLEKILDAVAELVDWNRANGEWSARRRSQDYRWLEARFREHLQSALTSSRTLKMRYRHIEGLLQSGSSIFSSSVTNELQRLTSQVSELLETIDDAETNGPT